MTFGKILDKFRKEALSQRDKGYKFEKLMQAYLQTDLKYAPLFSNVWLWEEFPARKDFGGKDTGVDLVARTFNGDYWAIQCKCYAESATIDKPAVDSFLSTSSRSFMDDNFQTVTFAHRLWISTTNLWGGNAEEAIRNQQPSVSRIGLFQLESASVDWEKLEKGLWGESSRVEKKKLYSHQQTALKAAHEHFKLADRGKLIMACGTGKTFTSLKIAENETNGKGLILFLVPSIALLGQTLEEWCAEASEPINAICICSDAEVSKKKKKNTDIDGYRVEDLALPASTNVYDILKQLNQFSTVGDGMTVVFSTYQSIEVIANAQQEYLKKAGAKAIFDLIICDEAHRTTGVTLAKEDESAFVKVHNNTFLQAKKRLYMTATPRLYSDDSKTKALQNDAILCSMDDVKTYGEEFYRIGFGEAVEKGMLSDYKVLILTVSENDMPVAVQKMVTNQENEISSDDVSKLIGCINALSKQIIGDADVIKSSDPDPMRRAVAFCQTIDASKKITGTFNSTLETYYSSLEEEQKDKMVAVSSDHIDGTMSATARQEKLSWLKSIPEDSKECRVLTNVRCLSEGVDVPSLDAVLFLSARNSQVDVVQSVGRVMRKSPGKKYGYIIIPVVVPADVAPEKALNDNERYGVVWSVLNALRAHDDRFNATVNKIELNRKKPDGIIIGRPDYGGERRESKSNSRERESEVAYQMNLQFEQLQSILFARMVQKVGDKRYWEQWAKDVALIAERHIERITRLVKQKSQHKQAFEEFITGLRKNINPAISESEAIEMLSQHIITKPVFEALFEDYSFVKNNPISRSMQRMIDLLEEEQQEADVEVLQKFYESVRMRAGQIDNAEGKQRIIVELYDKFFKTAFPRMVEKLGIVYTPVEIVDFIIHSVDVVLRKEFDRSLSDENIHILDPFTGTGTFITRLLQSGLIKKEDLIRKYTQEIHANEIVLLAYYIAAVNIENTFHDLMGEDAQYHEFNGICLTDTFQLGESETNEKLFSEMFPQNSERVIRQKKAPIRVIVGNPPYSIGQKSANDNAQNQSYPVLDGRIAKTYAEASNAGLNKSLYDAYIKAFRWATDRINKDNGGIIAFVSNGAWLDGNSTDGFRKCLEKDFSSIYIFNLRGNQRTSGELSRKEGGKIFGSGSRTPISITLLIKKPKAEKEQATIHYYDIGDYLNREEKLGIIRKFGSIEKTPFSELSPNEHGDWLNQRNDKFGEFIPLAPEKKFDILSKSVFTANAVGIATGRDTWVYNFSKAKIEDNMANMIAFYNQQKVLFQKEKEKNAALKIEDFIDKDPTKISWTRSLRREAQNNIEQKYHRSEIRIIQYRPYCSQYLYYADAFIESPGLGKKILPNITTKNKIISVSCAGTSKGLSVILTDTLSDYHFVGDTQCFPLYWYEENKTQQHSLFDTVSNDKYIRRDAISDFILERVHKAYGGKITKEDIFYYVYGLLHSEDYRITFEADLKKMLPRIPLVDEARDFWTFCKAGRALAELHLNYETPQMPKGVILNIAPGWDANYYVEKMRFPSKDNKSEIIYNNQITIENIPAEAYEYIVNGKSAIEWIMERYAITTHKESGITNNPNDWAKEHDEPRYILDLLLSVIKLSVETVEIVKALPKLTF